VNLNYRKKKFSYCIIILFCINSIIY